MTPSPRIAPRAVRPPRGRAAGFPALAVLAAALGGGVLGGGAPALADDCFIGEVRYFAGNFAPRDWAAADGSVLPIAPNTALFSILGTTYGGNGMTTFALPDLRGRVPMGVGQGPGLSPRTLGESAGTEQTRIAIAQLPPHNHAATTQVEATATVHARSDTAGSTASPAGAVWANGDRTKVYTQAAPDTTMAAGAVTVAASAATETAQTGDGQSLGLVQPSLVLTPIICISGIFPARN